MSRKSLPVVLAEAEALRLEEWIRAGSTPQQVVLRARIVLAAARGSTDQATAAALGIRRETAALWRRRAREQGIGCVWEIASGRGRKPDYDATYTHDYKRHGTTTLFAALQVLEGRVIGQCYQRHRHQEFLKFLRKLDAEFPDEKTLHLILDNYGTHGHVSVRRWLTKHPRFVLHFIPTSSSWLNLIERWFAELSQKAVRRGAFRSVRDLRRCIDQFLAAWNDNPTPFVWTASVERILAKIARARHRLEQIKPGCSHPPRL